MALKLEIKNWRPRQHPTGVIDRNDGVTKQSRFEYHGIVEIFTFKGSQKHTPFTTLRMYLMGREYQCRLPRHYDRRWFGRLANNFDWDCWYDAAKREGIK